MTSDHAFVEFTFTCPENSEEFYVDIDKESGAILAVYTWSDNEVPDDTGNWTGDAFLHAEKVNTAFDYIAGNYYIASSDMAAYQLLEAKFPTLPTLRGRGRTGMNHEDLQ